MSEAHEPPGLPTVVDEAADTPPWVPKLGLALLAAVVLYVVAMRVIEPASDPTPDDPAPAAAE
jgi:hypothetical protein